MTKFISSKASKTAAAYIRVSTEEQSEFSPDSQLKKITEYAVAHSLLLPECYIFSDEGISGRTAEKRPAFMRMIQTAKQKPRPFDVILLWKFSRFARNRQDSILYKSMLRRECGIEVISITEQLSQDPTSILIEALLEAMDEYYSLNLAQEVRRGMNEKFSRGGVVSSPPFGYRMGSLCFEPDPENAPIVKLIFASFLKGCSFRQIALSLNELGIKTRRGCPFQSRTIEYILTNPTYTGWLRRNTKGPAGPASCAHSSSPEDMTLVRGFHTPLISAADFQAASRKIQRQKNSLSTDRRSSGSSFPLQGLVRCSCCGATLTRTAKGNALQCHRYAKGQCSKSHYITLGAVEKSVFGQLEADLRFLLSGEKLKEPSLKKAKKLLQTGSLQTLPETEKNNLLRALISHIIFYRDSRCIEIFYYL